MIISSKDLAAEPCLFLSSVNALGGANVSKAAFDRQSFLIHRSVSGLTGSETDGDPCAHSAGALAVTAYAHPRRANIPSSGMRPVSGVYRQAKRPGSRSLTSLAVPMTKPSSSNRRADFDLFAPKAEAAWKSLNGRFASRLSDAELDHLYAVFIYGLTAPSYADREPIAHLQICRALLELNLSPERAGAALHAVPDITDPWVVSACQTMERRGTEIGVALAANNRNEEVCASAGAEEGQAITAEIRRNLQ